MPVQAPINYGLNVAPLNPAEQIMQGMQVGQGLLDAREQGLQRQQAAQMRPLQMQAAQLGLRTGLAAEADANAVRKLQADAQQSAAMRAAEMQARREELVSGVLSADKLRKFSILYPEQGKALEKTLESLSAEERRQFVSEAGQARAALEANDIDTATRFLEERATAREEVDPERAKALRNFAETARKNPFLARNMLGAFIAADDPTRFAESDTALQSQDAAVRERFAKAGEAEAKERIELVNAENRRKVIDSELGLQRAQTAKYYKDMDLDIQRLGFDREKFEAENARALKELDLKTQEIPTNLVPSVLKMSEESVASDMQADDWGSLASEFDKFEGGFGVSGTVATGLQGDASEVFKRVIGSDDAISVVRRRYLGMMAKGVVSNLPKGAASDADIALVKGGFPDDTSDPKKLARFSRAMENVERASARVKAARAEFLARNKGAGVARGNFSVGGVPVREGETEANVMKRIFAKQKLTE